MTDDTRALIDQTDDFRRRGMDGAVASNERVLAGRVPALLDRIEALEREVRGLYDDKAHDADAIKAGRDRIEALEAALQEADPHNAMLPPEGANHG